MPVTIISAATSPVLNVLGEELRPLRGGWRSASDRLLNNH